MNDSTDNIELLIDVSDKLKGEDKEAMDAYLKHFRIEKISIQEFNISRYKAKNLLKKN